MFPRQQQDTEHHADGNDSGKQRTDAADLHPFILDVYLYGDTGLQPAGHRFHHKRQQGTDVVYGWFNGKLKTRNSLFHTQS